MLDNRKTRRDNPLHIVNGNEARSQQSIVERSSVILFYALVICISTLGAVQIAHRFWRF